jgi:hypothetical protein
LRWHTKILSLSLAHAIFRNTIKIFLFSLLGKYREPAPEDSIETGRFFFFHRAFLFSNHTHYKFVTESHNGPELLQICNNTYTGFSPGLQADHIQRPEETNTPQNKLEVLYNAADK